MHPTFQEDLLQSYSDADLIHYISEAPVIGRRATIRVLSANLLAKGYRPDVAEDSLAAMERARELGIRVPCVKRVIKDDDGDVCCIMERIEGSALVEAWPKLSWFTTVKLAFQLRRFIHLLRSVTSSTAGSLATGECRSFYLSNKFKVPARSTPEAITYFIRFWVNFKSLKAKIRKARGETPQDSAQSERWIPTTVDTFVFTHHDLAPRNIILHPSGQLWLIDWDYAGFYPSYFEYAAMQNFRTYHDWSWLARMRWRVFSGIAAGRSECERHVLDSILLKLDTFPTGRRFELLKNGGPSRRPVS